MKNYLKESTEHTNDLTKVVAMAIGFLLIFYFADLFFDNWEARSPVIIRFQAPVIKRYKNRLEVEPLPTTTPKKKETRKEGAKFGQVLAVEREIDPAREALYVYFGDDKVAYAVARAESGLRCNAISSTSDYGLFQIHLPLHQWRFDKFGGKWDNCDDNARVAFEIQKEQGWTPWSVYNNGSYLSFL